MVWAAQAKAPPQGKNYQSLLLMGLLMVFFMWFIVLRPQKREKQERERLLNSLKKGDRVISVGGLHGKVVEVDATHGVVTVEIAPKVAVKINRTAISVVDSKDPSKTPGPEEKEAEKTEKK
jgi:preprotein translocase subunit YajC